MDTLPHCERVGVVELRRVLCNVPVSGISYDFRNWQREIFRRSSLQQLVNCQPGHQAVSCGSRAKLFEVC